AACLMYQGAATAGIIREQPAFADSLKILPTQQEADAEARLRRVLAVEGERHRSQAVLLQHHAERAAVHGRPARHADWPGAFFLVGPDVDAAEAGGGIGTLTAVGDKMTVPAEQVAIIS